MSVFVSNESMRRVFFLLRRGPMVVVHHARKKNNFIKERLNCVLCSTALARDFYDIRNIQRDFYLRIAKRRERLFNAFQAGLIFYDSSFLS